jgi:hypothetical protein
MIYWANKGIIYTVYRKTRKNLMLQTITRGGGKIPLLVKSVGVNS